MILLYIAIVFTLLYYLITKNNTYWESRGIVYEKPFLFFGNFFSVVRGKQHLSERIREIYSQYKTPYVGIHVFTQPNLMVRSSDLLKKILVKDFDKFVNRPVAADEKADPVAFHTLFTSKDSTWRNLRAKISPVFTSGKMKLMLPLMKECTNDLVRYLDDHNGQTIEIKDVFKRYSVDIISSCAFGINSYCLKDENSEVLNMATRLLDTRSLKRNISILSFFFLPKLVSLFRLNFVDKFAGDYLLNIFDKTMKERKKLKIERNDLIDLLYTLKKNETITDKYKFDDLKMASQALSFFSAGNDTTASTLSFALYELAINPNVQDRLREEVVENTDFSYENLHKMKYLDWVLKETHRKYPLTTFLSRQAATDYTIEETGLKLKKGDCILVPLSGLHYDPEIFPEPEKFDPERFNDDNKGSIPQYTYMLFGDGPRVCIGERFASQVTKLALASAIKNFRFEKTNSTQVPLKLSKKSLFLQSEKGIHLKIVRI